MARRMKGARKMRAMRDIEKGLRMLTTGLRRLARDLSAVRSVPAAPAARRRPVTRALRLQGRYMGLIRNLPARKKQQVMAARASHGVERAIRMAREFRA
jgi:hypothetical protein